MEKTRHPQNQIIATPLYLLQIYWIIIRNCNDDRIKTVIQDGSLLVWEKEFFDALKRIHLTADLPQRDFWSQSFNKKIAKKISTDTFSSKQSVGAFLENAADNGPLALAAISTGRIDRKIPPVAEALGLINRPLDDANPTPFFYSLLPPNSNGSRAVASLLVRMFSLGSSTLEFVKHPPRKLIEDKILGRYEGPDQFLSGSLPNQHRLATFNVYADPLDVWLKADQGSETLLIAAEILRLIPQMERIASEDWRQVLPQSSLIDSVLNAIKTDSKRLTIIPKMPEPTSMRTTNIILAGPPGTGKSKVAALLALELSKGASVTDHDIRNLEMLPPAALDSENSRNILWTQFHPSYSYEDFVEGIRPVANARDISKVRYAIVPGPLKTIAQLARVYWSNADKRQKYLIPILAYFDGQKRKLTIPKEYSLYNLPNREGTLYQLNDANEHIVVAKTGAGLIELLPGDEDKAAKSCYLDLFWGPSRPDSQHFVLVIDEINRGNTAKIFGELLSLIEPSKRLGERDNIELTLVYSKESFSLPPNLHIISTMNQADRSLSMMDQAFRRRFHFTYLPPNFDLIRNELQYVKCSSGKPYDRTTNEVIAQHFENLNKALAGSQVSEDQLIGHSYAFDALNRILDSGCSVKEAIFQLWNSELHNLIRDLIPSELIDDFVSLLETEEKQKPTIEIKDLKVSLKRSIPTYKAA